MAIVTYTAVGTPIFAYVAIFSLFLPLIIFGAIYRLITVHNAKLYAPKDFANPGDFLEVIDRASKSMQTIGQKNARNIYKPLGGDEKLESRQTSRIDRQFSAIETILSELKPLDFLAFHGWFNAENRHELALISMDIAIAKGASDVRNFSFRSASLRKLGRIPEAINSAQFALELSPGDPDALYNLARCYLSQSNIQAANNIKESLAQARATVYEKRLTTAIEYQVKASSN